MRATVLTVTPTITAAAYSSGNQLGGLNKLTSAANNSGGQTVIVSITLVDAAKQNSAIDVLFFRDKPTVASSDNAALDISASEMKSKFIGAVSLAAANYKSLANASYVVASNVQHVLDVVAGSQDLYMILQARGTPTYASASDLELRIGLAQSQS